jgi:DNA repair exonuclease SbcCD ATPase subunit
LEKLRNEDKIKEKQRLVKQLEEGTICPTCNRKLEDVDHTDEINTLKKEILKLSKLDYDSTLKSLNVDLLKFKELKQQLDLYEKNKLIKARYELEVEQKNVEIKNKKSQLDEYYKNSKKLEDNKKIDEQLTTIKTQIDSVNGEIKITTNNITKHQNNIVLYNDRITNNIELIKKIKAEQDTVQIFKIYFSIFGKNGISKVILKNMIPLLNNELYRLLIDSCHFILELNINDKNEVEFVMIDTETRVVKPLNSGSGYERTISSLALRSVLTKISSLPKPNVVVMDEVFGKIADENLEMVGEFFKKIKSYFEHIMVISHNPLIRNWTDNLIMIRKDNNVSSIEYVN